LNESNLNTVLTRIQNYNNPSSVAGK